MRHLTDNIKIEDVFNMISKTDNVQTDVFRKTFLPYLQLCNIL